MVFSSSEFMFLFLPITAIIYYISRLIFKKHIEISNLWLMLVSLFFYAWGEPVYVLLMAASIVVNYLLGLWVDKYPKSKNGKRIVFIACVYNLGMLFVFKYLGWILGVAGYKGDSPIANLMLPIGISFYTFQALSYVIDVYRGKDPAQKNIVNVGLYISFFPQLIAGPIVRYRTIAEQLEHRKHTLDGFVNGAWRFTIGLSKKVLLANNLASIADLAYKTQGSELSVVLSWVGALAFMLQVYFDFSGYSDMAIGLGKMFGFTFEENFNYPFISKSVGEYWRRWHISLGEWFRDYVFYPFSQGPAIKLRKRLSKKVSRKTAANIAMFVSLFVVWFLTGIWHGANFTFIVWGLVQFIVIYLEGFKKPAKNVKLAAVLGFVFTFLFTILTKVIFKSESMSAAGQYYMSMFHLNGNELSNPATLYWIGQYKVVLIAGLIFSFPVIKKINSLVENRKTLNCVWNVIKTIAMIVLLAADIGFLLGGGYNPFIYFNF